MEKILKYVSVYYNIPIHTINQRSRHGEVVRARQMAWLLMFEKGHYFSEISRFFEMNHATVQYGIRKMQVEIKTYTSVKTEYEKIQSLMDPKFKPKDKYYGGIYPVLCNTCT